MPQTCTRAARCAAGVAVAVRTPSRHRAQVRAVELRAHDDLASGPTLSGAAHRRGALGEQRRDATVEDAVGLVDLRTDLDREDDLLGGDLDDRGTPSVLVDASVLGEADAPESSLIRRV